jgi:hypothetical protein
MQRCYRDFNMSGDDVLAATAAIEAEVLQDVGAAELLMKYVAWCKITRTICRM